MINYLIYHDLGFDVPHKRLITKHKKHFYHQSAFYHLAQCLSLSVFCDTPSDNAPKIWVVLSCHDNSKHLHLSYFIEKTDWLKLDDVADNVTRQDYLWENNCLECFMSKDNVRQYYELNVALSGNFNIYQFQNYRTPNTLPPMQAAGSVSISQEYDDRMIIRHISVCVEIPISDIKHINPCVILYRDNTAYFYAVQHATPPDFHDKAYWQTLNLA
ncbi:hypothetical protein LU293_02940 [Moraxella nasovis]|uniref:hypothetical protein n=1 Tax=Moraxella nasovis TaxID=2904121 RepID=UPI001F619C7C|nr:hypothetical protein [Moraxella nasovis]UNU73871.1 hypothetical protein LU293_02940 [Moraxella nasovis]